MDSNSTDLVSQIHELSAEVQDLNTLHKLFSNVINHDNLEFIYKEILDVAVSLSSTEKGSLQIYDENSKVLKMIISRGLSQSFVTDFCLADLNVGACGLSLKTQKRVYAEDVRFFPIYKGRQIVDNFLEENIYSQQSIPLISGTGKRVGVLNTYHAQKKDFCERELRMLDILARIAADIIEHNKTEISLFESEKKAIALVEELKEADRNKNNFLYSVSHELRNPLATLKAALSLLKVTDDRGKIQKNYGIMAHQIDQLCHLVDDLLDLTRINNHKIRLDLELKELKNLIITASEDFKTLFDKKGIRFCIEASSDRILAKVDSVRIVQILHNLLNNSLKFTESGGAVTLKIYKTNGNAVISVKDNGIGIKPEFLPFLFEPFKQVHNPIEKPNSGLGLGLAIVKAMTEMHHGSISVKSQGIGKGTEVSITLPLCFKNIAC